MISILGFIPLLFSLKLFKYLESQMENENYSEFWASTRDTQSLFSALI